MTILANAKSRLSNSNVKEAFKNEAGAIDLASIMVGIIVIGLIGGVIAATVFAVIPWAQDNAAKQQLDSIVAAQSAYVGLSADGAAGSGGDAIMFGDRTGLNTKGLYATTAPGRVAVTGSGGSAHYAAAVQSASGKVFYVTDNKTQPTQAGTTGNSTNATFTNNTIPGGTVIGGVTFGTNVAPVVDVPWTGDLK